MKKNDDVFALCMPVAENNHTKGSVRICVKCSVPLWLSDTTITAITNQGGKSEDISPICFECVTKELEKEKVDNISVMPPSKEQLDEARNSLLNEDLRKKNQAN